MDKQVRILGIDPGSRMTGYGLIQSDGRQSTHIVSGGIPLTTGDLSDRLGIIFSEVSQLIELHGADQLAIESVFVSRNPASALKLGHARGAAMCAAVNQSLPVSEYSPRSIKQAIVGKGSADKTQVQHMVRILLNLTTTPQADAADALAVALCHAHTCLQRLGNRAQIASGARH